MNIKNNELSYEHTGVEVLIEKLSNYGDFLMNSNSN